MLGLCPYNDEGNLVKLDFDTIKDGIWKFEKFPEGFCIVEKCQCVDAADLDKNACKRKWHDGFHVLSNEFSFWELLSTTHDIFEIFSSRII